MTCPDDPLDRVRAANPLRVPVEPDWNHVKEYVASLSRADCASGPAASADVGVRAALTPRLYRPAHVRGDGRRLRRVLGASVLCAAVATGIFVAVAPWNGSSGFLARAAAALNPEPGAILYERWEHIIAPEPGNPARKVGATFGPEQLWIEDDSPHHFRAVLKPGIKSSTVTNLASTYGVVVGYVGVGLNFASGQNEVLEHLERGLAGRPLELGGATTQKRPGEVPPTLTFLPPKELLSARLSVTLGAPLPSPHDQAIEDGTDPVSVLRAAIAEGRAHEAGTTQLHGRTVRRIDFDLPQHLPADAPPMPADAPVFGHAEAYAYVEPKTFHPVEIVWGGTSDRFLAYEYLPATAANLALTNIQAQHPNATILAATAALAPKLNGTAPMTGLGEYRRANPRGRHPASKGP